ncbi:hypothetical protein [Parafrigoribacterium soli]|uniref:hypothetical protein n=1 Tax=Parafrigoribacterium soli TaxID=3144663 RepID=UPI0032EDF15E
MPARLELPSWRNNADDAQRTRATIDAWASSSALGDLVRASGGAPPALGPAPLLDWLDEFAAAHWDFRRGAERNLATRVTLPVELERAVARSAPALGLAGPYPDPGESYDTILMTGGMIRAGIVKPRFARELLVAGLRARSIVFLGGFRPFAGDELSLARVLGVHGDNEFDAMTTGMQLAFGPLGEPEVTGAGSGNAGWRSWRWGLDDVTLRVVAAPSSEAALRRANTPDTYRFWASHLREPSERSVLVVTTPIYVPYQGTGAVEILGLEHDLRVETVGTSETANDLGEHSQRFLAQHQLQELRAAIGAMRRLRARLSEGPAEGASSGDH